MSKSMSEEALQSLNKLRRAPPSDPQAKLKHLDIEAEVLFHKSVQTGILNFRTGAENAQPSLRLYPDWTALGEAAGEGHMLAYC